MVIKSLHEEILLFHLHECANSLDHLHIRIGLSAAGAEVLYTFIIFQAAPSCWFHMSIATKMNPLLTLITLNHIIIISSQSLLCP